MQFESFVAVGSKFHSSLQLICDFFWDTGREGADGARGGGVGGGGGYVKQYLFVVRIFKRLLCK